MLINNEFYHQFEPIFNLTIWDLIIKILSTLNLMFFYIAYLYIISLSPV